MPASGGQVECTIFVKAAPERSVKYGDTVCTAGILDDGRLIRLYPIPIDEYWRTKIKKYARVRVDVVPSDERAQRPESHKLVHGLKLVSAALADGAPWDDRMRLIRPAVNPRGLQGLRELQTEHRTSLGVVKVREIRDFYVTAPLDQILEQATYRESEQKTLLGPTPMVGSKVDRLKHVFRYTWRCMGPCCDDNASGQGYHDTTCEDWELFEAFRQWRTKYDDPGLLKALKEKFFDQMGTADLHFAVGTPSDPKTQNSWMIIGLIYPGSTKKPGAPTICSRTLTGADILQPDPKLDSLVSREIKATRGPPNVPGKWF